MPQIELSHVGCVPQLEKSCGDAFQIVLSFDLGSVFSLIVNSD